MERVSITGVGSYLPKKSLDNDTLPALDKPVSAEDKAKIGVHRRGWAEEEETIPFMAAEAARRALAQADVAAESLDMLVLSNWTQRRYLPDFAPKVQALLGAHKAFAFDVGCACAGFVYGVGMVHGFMQSLRVNRALVVAAETTSQRGRPASKSTLVFGDGAGAFVLERGADRGATLVDFQLATDGRHFEAMEINEAGHVVTHIDQKQLIHLATKSFADMTNTILERNGLSLQEVRWIVPHSGTAGVQAALLKTLDVPADKVLTNFATVGNTSSAAIPIALDHFLRERTIKPGDLVLSPTTGSGWYAAAMLYRAG